MNNDNKITKPVTKSKRAKTFTGCWTCRARKVKCDLRRPSCVRCIRSGLECGGYDIKLRWSHLVQFDEFGTQINSSVTISGPTSRGDSNNSNNDSDNPDKPRRFQRRNIDFVKYDEEYVFHEDMDDELTLLHAPPPEKVANGKTWMIKKFGVFLGRDRSIANERKNEPQRQTSTNNPKNVPIESSPVPSKLNNNDSTNKKDEVICPEIYEATMDDNNNESVVADNDTTTTTPLGNSKLIGARSHSTNVIDLSDPKMMGYNADLTNFPGFEWIAKELREDVLLSAFASQGTPFDSNVLVNNNGNDNLPSKDQDSSQRQLLPNDSHNDGNYAEQNFDNRDPLGPAVKSALHSLFQKPDNIDINKLQTQNHEKGVIISHKRDIIEIHAPDSENGMPKTAIEVIDSKVDDYDSLTKCLQQSDVPYNIPKVGLLVHGLTRFLLSYYYDKVADLMTVVALPEKNPWKKLYFPRALAALGDLAGLGYTSNSRNCLLNALLAVSCFNLKSKLPKNSKEQTLFLNLGIEFRTQATGFLKKCLSSTVLEERYKDVLTAVLSMNSIDVVWGTMSDCQQHLNLGERFIEYRMEHRPKLSEKAKTLHRIFSFLKLIQDSTALDKVNSNEIVFSSNTPPNGDHVSASANADGLSGTKVQMNGKFKESLDQRDGKIRIEFVQNKNNDRDGQSTTTGSPEDPGNISPPIFENLSSNSFIHTKSALSEKMDIVDIETLYGLPNSLILLFSDCVTIVRHTKYYNMKYIPVPRQFIEVTQKFEKRLMKWKPEWEFYTDASDNGVKRYVDDTIEALYYHTMSFYNALIIYYFSMARDLSNDFLQQYVSKVLDHLQKMNTLIEDKKVKIVPLIWQGFIAGCASTKENEQAEYRKWAAKLAECGMGSYWGARQVMFEVWRRRNAGAHDDDWFSVYQDWEMNLMLS